MQKNPIAPPPPPISLGDIYYVLFKHKWKILILSAIGITGAAIIFLTSKPPYISEAKLLVKYVQEVKGVGEEKIRPMSMNSDAIMTTEANILSSLDVASSVVEVFGAEKIVGKEAKLTNAAAAALILKKQLEVDVPQRGGNVLRVMVKNDDPTVVQPLLRHIIDAYFRKHVEIHRNLGLMDDSLTQLTDQAKARLAETEESLRKMKSDAGIQNSLEATRLQLTDRLSRVVEELRLSEVELEERRAALKELQKASLVEAPVAAATNQVVSETNQIANAATTNQAGAAAVAKNSGKPSEEVMDEYQRLMARLDVFRKREQELLANFRPESTLVREARENVVALEKEKRAMLEGHPGLADEESAPAPAVASAPGSPVPRADIRALQISAENSRIVALVAKITTLNHQLEKVKADMSNLDKFEKDLIPLQRRKELEESNYRYYSTTLNQARFDNSLAGGQLSNIKEIQAPSLPYRDKSSMMKLVAMTALAGIGLGFGLAFVLELALNQSIRKPVELEQKFKLPNFLTIPDFGKKRRGGKRPLRGGSSAAKALPESTNGVAKVGAANGSALAVTPEIPPWDEHHDLHPYSEALRDRLMSFFEIKGLTHKPKLVAITSCSHGAGVTTLAAGLAASLSETGEGNVLLVDMNTNRESAHPFFRGKPACGLSDVLEHEKRPAALVQDNLYMVQGAVADDRLPHILPKRMQNLIPKLQTSDYDYIIFDMPPITQTSVTPRLAGFMDMVFVVVEDDKTNRDFLKQASRLLQDSKANLGAVFNKRRAYVPRWLHQEF